MNKRCRSFICISLIMMTIVIIGEESLKAASWWDDVVETLKSIFDKERGADDLHTLVIMDTEGEILNSLIPTETGEVRSPIWLPNEKIVFVERHGMVSTLKIVSATFEDRPGDFGSPPIEGVEPYLTPDGQSIIFRQRKTIIRANLEGTDVAPLFEDKDVDQILGVFPDSNPGRYSLVFLIKVDQNIHELYVAEFQGTELLSLELKFEIKPSDLYWQALAQIKIFGEQMLYERKDKGATGKDVWNIYLSPKIQEHGKKITDDRFHDRYPSWNSDRTKIVFVSGELK